LNCDRTNFESVDTFVDDSSDVYRRSNPKEAIEIVEPLKQLANKVDLFAAEFDDHPTLLSIKTVILRVLALPIFVPVISLCTGVEMVLSRVNDWHVNAPKRYSLQEQSDSLWNMVVKWRKQELTEWKLILGKSSRLH
jgi:midasin (ATPase involved in ribosome maturation)